MGLKLLKSPVSKELPLFLWHYFFVWQLSEKLHLQGLFLFDLIQSLLCN